MMNSQELESRYASLKRARDSRNITDAQFQNEVAQLRFQAPEGTWYQIDPGDGHWLKWNGQAWERAGSSVSQKPAAPVQQQPPPKFLPLLSLIIKNTLRVFLRQLPGMIFFGILAWLLHTFLLVFVNEGFGEGSFVSKFLATQSNTLSGTIIWMVASSLLFGWLGRKSNKGQGKAFSLSSLQSYFHEAQTIALTSILVGAGLSMIIGGVVSSYANLALAVGFGSLMLSGGGSVIGLLISSAWSSAYSLAQPKQKIEYNAATAHMAMAGSVAGFVLSYFLPPGSKVFFGIGALAGAFVLTRRQGQSSTGFLLSILPPLLVLSAAVYILRALPVFADDGGWKEAGGTFSSWIDSQGAITAMLMGTGPALGSMFGPAFLQALAISGGNIGLWDGASTMDTSVVDLSKHIKPATTTLKPGEAWPGGKEKDYSGENPFIARREDLNEHELNRNIMFQDKEGNGEDRMMTQKLKDAIDTLAAKVKTEWPDKKLYIADSWDPNRTPKDNHSEGRASDLHIFDEKTKKIDKDAYGRLGQMATESGFDWVWHEIPKDHPENVHVHASVSREATPKLLRKAEDNGSPIGAEDDYMSRRRYVGDEPVDPATLKRQQEIRADYERKWQVVDNRAGNEAARGQLVEGAGEFAKELAPNWIKESKLGSAAVEYLGESLASQVTDKHRLLEMVREATTRKSYSLSGEATSLNQKELSETFSNLYREGAKTAISSVIGKATGVENLWGKTLDRSLTLGEGLKTLVNGNSDNIAEIVVKHLNIR